MADVPMSNVEQGKQALTERDFDAAARYFQTAVAQDSSDVEAWAGLGTALGAAGRYQEAVRALGEAGRLDPTNARILYNLGAALEMTGETKQARDAYQSALRIQPHHQLAQEALRRLPGGFEDMPAGPSIGTPPAAPASGFAPAATPPPPAQAGPAPAPWARPGVGAPTPPPLAPPRPGGPAANPWGQAPPPPPTPRLGVRPGEVPTARPSYARKPGPAEVQPAVPGRWPAGAIVGVVCGFILVTILQFILQSQLLPPTTPNAKPIPLWCSPSIAPPGYEILYWVGMLCFVASCAAIGALVAGRADAVLALWLSPMCWVGSVLIVLLVDHLTHAVPAGTPAITKSGLNGSVIQFLGLATQGKTALVILGLAEVVALLGAAFGALIASIVAVTLQPRKTSTAALLGVAISAVAGPIVYGLSLALSSAFQGKWPVVAANLHGLAGVYGWVAGCLGVIVGLATAPTGKGFRMGLVAAGVPIALIAAVQVLTTHLMMSALAAQITAKGAAVPEYIAGASTAALKNAVIAIICAALVGGGVAALVYALVGQSLAPKQQPYDSLNPPPIEANPT